MTAQNVNQIIEALHLAPLPREGGYYRQNYITEHSTAIYYLLHGDAFSHLHRLPYDEVYHFYLGEPVILWELLPDGTAKQTILGSDVSHGQQMQYVVRAGNWQGSCLLSHFTGKTVSDEQYALLGTTMSPPYSDECYEHGSRDDLLEKFPHAEHAIRQLTN